MPLTARVASSGVVDHGFFVVMPHKMVVISSPSS